jgi:AraC-like DNA-binding protein
VVESGLRLYRPASPLGDYIEYLGHWDSDGATPYKDRALPRGAATIVVDVGPRQHLSVYAADGDTRLAVPPAFVAGPHASSYVTDIVADSSVMAVHFRPAGASPFLGVGLGDLGNACVGLEIIWGHKWTLLHERLVETPSVSARFALLEAFLLSCARLAIVRDPVVAIVMDALETSPALTVAEMRELAGLSPKRLITLFRSEVGLAPKPYARVRRFQAALRRVQAGTARGADIAAAVGYFDQAHLVREFRSFTAMTPTEYMQRQIRLPSHVPVHREKYPIPGSAKSALLPYGKH